MRLKGSLADMGTFINSFFGRIASLRGARNPHVLKYIPVSCAPCALHRILTIEFLGAPGNLHYS